MPNHRKRKNSKGNELEELKWELRKRGVRPTGTVQSMLRKLEDLKHEEDRVQQARMNNNKKKCVMNAEHSNNSVGNNKMREKRKNGISEERSQLVLWRQPLKTMYYFLREIPCSILDARDRFAMSLYDPRKKTIPISRRLMIFMLGLGMFYSLYFFLFKDDDKSRKIKDEMYWYAYWVFLGILSSVGLGTGLHTFLLYLGPFIAKVSLAAQECGSVQFPKPPYPEVLLCPEVRNPDGITVYDIMSKIRWESLMWGFGTALGELPPYFMARAARISGFSDGETLEDFNHLLQRRKNPRDITRLGFLERGKLWMQDLVEKVGFWGILACASIPNPLFDLAGITCGHFLVPFSTFFGATVIGKAVVKVHLQMIFVILAFNEELLESAVNLIRAMPTLGPILSDPFVELMNHQKATLHNRAEGNLSSEPGALAIILERFVMSMVIYFVISIINAMAQSYHKRITANLKEREKSKTKS